MKIVLACSSYFVRRGGIAIYNRNAHRALERAGHDVLVLAPDVPEDAQPCFAGFETPEGREAERAEIARINRTILDFAPGVVMSSDCLYVTGLFASLPVDVARVSVSHFASGYLAKAAIAADHHTDWIIALSGGGCEFLRNRVLHPWSVKTVYNFAPDTEPAERKSHGIQVCYPGGRQPHKRPDLVAKIATELRRRNSKIHLVWLGESGPWSDRLKNKAMFLGNVQQAQALRIYQESDLFLLPSDNEGCPMSMVEAMQCGCVPIVSDCPSAMKEIVQHEVSGWVLPRGDHRPYVDLLCRIEEQPALLEGMDYSARARVSQIASESAWLGQMAECFVRRADRTIPVEPKPRCLTWHRRPGSWKRPTISYLRWKLGLPNLSPI